MSALGLTNIMNEFLWISKYEVPDQFGECTNDSDEAISLLLENRYKLVSLSCDTTEWDFNPMDILAWMYGHKTMGGYIPNSIEIHGNDEKQKTLMERFIRSHLLYEKE